MLGGRRKKHGRGAGWLPSTPRTRRVHLTTRADTSPQEPLAMVRTSNSPQRFAILALAALAPACGGQSDFADVAAPEEIQEYPDGGGDFPLAPGNTCGTREFPCADAGAPGGGGEPGGGQPGGFLGGGQQGGGFLGGGTQG